MDPTHVGGDVSPRKKKWSQSHLRGGSSCSVVQRVPERHCESIPHAYTKNEQPRAQDALKLKKTHGRKRYESLRSVSMGTADDPTASCSATSPGELANGAAPVSLAPPPARLPPRAAAKADGARQPQEARNPKSPSGEDPTPPFLSARKEPATYPEGSEEERWQIQIAAKGRAACPKCRSVSRKTVEGLKKHMDNCRQQPFTCQHCGKQLKSSTGMKYHVMADHSHLPSAADVQNLDDRAVKEKLRQILKRLGKLKCAKEGCTAAFTSIMGYVYHMKKCGKEESELEKMLLNCSHCGKTYKSKAGLEYHLKSEHAPAPPKTLEDEASPPAQRDAVPQRTASGRVQRASAQVANFHLAEIANNDLPKDWPKRKFRSDLVPDDHKLKYARPGLPAFSQEVLRKWKNEVKLQRKVQCPNQGCCCTYTSVSGLKAHLGLCIQGDFEAGKYKCLLCSKEFNSESGVKYHINSVHSQDWFVTDKKASRNFERFLKNRPRHIVQEVDQQIVEQFHRHHQDLLHLHPHPDHHPHHHHHRTLLQMQPVHLHPAEPLPQQEVLQYTPLEPPPPGPLWLEQDVPPEAEEDAGKALGGVIVEVRGRREAGARRRDCFVFAGGGGDGGSSSESEAEPEDRRRHVDQWGPGRAGVTEARPEAAKRQRST